MFYALIKHNRGEAFSLVANAEARAQPAAGQAVPPNAWRQRLVRFGPWLALALLIALRLGYRHYQSSYTAPGLLRQASGLYEDQRYGEAIAALDSAIQRQPDSMKAYLLRGLSRQELGQFDQAQADYQAALALDPADPAALQALGLLYAETGRPQAALATYADIVRANPSYDYVYYARGKLYRELGENTAARADFERYLALGDPRGLRPEVEALLAGLAR